MTTPASPNAISLNDVNTELGLTATDSISMNAPAVRKLAGKTTVDTEISMSDLRNKQSRLDKSITTNATLLNYVLDTTKVTGYVKGITDVIFTVGPGAYVYSNSTATPALTITGFTTGDTVTVVNNGFIMGMGGNGGTEPGAGATGGPAISVNCPGVTITNNSYIGGGGGGGGYGGGGGAGGGTGGNITNSQTSGGAGGSPGNVGGNGGGYPYSTHFSPNLAYGAGGGGRIMPGTGGGGAGGGGAGGGGGYSISSGYTSGSPGSGGGAGASGGNGSGMQGGGGGGGWGASGGTGGDYGKKQQTTAGGGTGGKAINLNGQTVARNGPGTTYGVVG